MKGQSRLKSELESMRRLLAEILENWDHSEAPGFAMNHTYIPRIREILRKKVNEG